jgi:hypothetical protein
MDRCLSAVVLGLLLLTPHSVFAQPASSDGPFPLDKLIGQISSAVSWLITPRTQATAPNRQDGLGRLVIHLSQLSGMELALADTIDLLAANPPLRQGNPQSIVLTLNGQWAQIRGQFDLIARDIALSIQAGLPKIHCCKSISGTSHMMEPYFIACARVRASFTREVRGAIYLISSTEDCCRRHFATM